MKRLPHHGLKELLHAILPQEVANVKREQCIIDRALRDIPPEPNSHVIKVRHELVQSVVFGIHPRPLRRSMGIRGVIMTLVMQGLLFFLLWVLPFVALPFVLLLLHRHLSRGFPELFLRFSGRGRHRRL